MKKQAFRDRDLKLYSIGNVFNFDKIDYKFMACNSYSWKRRYPDKDGGREGYITHPDPSREKLGILPAFNKTIIEQYEGININITVVAFYSCGPCGSYTDIFGHIGDMNIRARALMSGTAQRYDYIETISSGNYLIIVDYDLNYFLLAIFKKKDW